MRNHWYIKIWEEGHNFDFWHVHHFLAGILFACTSIALNINIVWAFIASLTLMISWEVFEVKFGIFETKFNMCFDVIFAVISFWITVYLEKNSLSVISFYNFFKISVILYTVLGLWGFWAYQVRTRAKNQ